MTTLIRNGRLLTPTGLKVAPQSYAALEQVAEQMRGMLPHVQGERFMLNCSAILEKTLQKAGFNLRIDAREDLDEVAAFTVPDLGLIVFREDIYCQLEEDMVFARSTVIHELSHIVLRHSATLHRGATLGNHRFCEDSEWQAKAQTAAIMMPVAACKVARYPEELAEMCGTSVEASTYRLDRLAKAGLIPKKTFSWEDI